MERVRTFLVCRVRGLSLCKVMPWLLIGLAALVLFTGFGTRTAFQNVSVRELYAASESDRILLDVREPFEFAEGHIPGSILMPLGRVAVEAGDLPRDATVYVICRSGNRSVTASEILVQLGFTDVRNVMGGILAWQSAGHAIAR